MELWNYGEVALTKFNDAHVKFLDQEPFNISISTAASTKIRIDWGDGVVWTSSTNTSFSTSNTYTGKANTDEYVVSVGGINITIINISSNQITYFNIRNLWETIYSEIGLKKRPIIGLFLNLNQYVFFVSIG